MDSRTRVYASLEGSLPDNERIPRQLWVLPWADQNCPGAREKLQREFPDDIVHAPGFLTSPVNEGRSSAMYRKGTYIDEWGCVFENRQEGIIGEVKQPIVEDWDDTSRVRIPEEALNLDSTQINAFCRDTDQFVLAGACQRPFERLQFIRGTENLYVDLALEEPGLHEFIEKLHAFHLKELEAWSRTDVDGLFIMDDWGTQKSLLISPELWRRVFKPLYKDYADLARSAGKKIFMHSDGCIVDIYPDLIELGIDAINSQIFCMGVEKLAAFKGQITFWGEMDRQHLLPHGTVDEVRDAVNQIYDALYENGGLIAQCEFGPGARPENIHAMYDAWNTLQPAARFN